MKNVLDSHLVAYKGQSIYDFDNEIMLNWYPKRIIKHSNNSESLLELGLGHGFSTNIFSKHFKKLIVLDGSKAIIKNFKNRFPSCKVEIIETFFEDFETDEKFDVISMGFVLEHVEDPIKIIRYYKKFLNKDGRIFIAVPNAEVLNRRLGNLAGLLPDICSLSKNDHDLGHKRYYTIKTLTEDIITAGFKIEKMEGVYLKPFTTSQIISLNLDESLIDSLCQVAISYPELSCGLLAEITKVK